MDQVFRFIAAIAIIFLTLQLLHSAGKWVFLQLETVGINSCRGKSLRELFDKNGSYVTAENYLGRIVYKLPHVHNYGSVVNNKLRIPSTKDSPSAIRSTVTAVTFQLIRLFFTIPSKFICFAFQGSTLVVVCLATIATFPNLPYDIWQSIMSTWSSIDEQTWSKVLSVSFLSTALALILTISKFTIGDRYLTSRTVRSHRREEVLKALTDSSNTFRRLSILIFDYAEEYLKSFEREKNTALSIIEDHYGSLQSGTFYPHIAKHPICHKDCNSNIHKCNTTQEVEFPKYISDQINDLEDELSGICIASHLSEMRATLTVNEFSSLFDIFYPTRPEKHKLTRHPYTPRSLISLPNEDKWQNRRIQYIFDSYRYGTLSKGHNSSHKNRAIQELECEFARLEDTLISDLWNMATIHKRLSCISAIGQKVIEGNKFDIIMRGNGK